MKCCSQTVANSLAMVSEQKSLMNFIRYRTMKRARHVSSATCAYLSIFPEGKYKKVYP